MIGFNWNILFIIWKSCLIGLFKVIGIQKHIMQDNFDNSNLFINIVKIANFYLNSKINNKLFLCAIHKPN